LRAQYRQRQSGRSFRRRQTSFCENGNGNVLQQFGWQFAAQITIPEVGGATAQLLWGGLGFAEPG